MDLKTLRETPPWDWPEEAGNLLLATLVDKLANESDRLVAAELAGDIVVMNDELADALLAIVANRNESEELRAKTAISLGPVLELSYQDGLDDADNDDPPITEHTFRSIQDLLRKLYLDERNPKEVRRRILEAAGRAPDDWHANAIRDAYATGDKDWMVTAVFVMRWVRGFEAQILEALGSTDPDIHFEAVNAAGGWGLDAAWPHIVALVHNPATPKPLLLAAIEAVGNIRPPEADVVLSTLLELDDEEVAEAAEEAIATARALSGEADDEPSESGWVN